MLKWIERLIRGRPETDGERQERRKAKMLMLGAGAGSAAKAGPDGVVRVEELHGDGKVRPGGGS
jgi:hypothetical protein